MPDYPPTVADAAAILAARRRQHERGPRLPASCRPLDVDTALAIQAAVVDRLGEHIGGWKCATPSGNTIVLAPIPASSIRSADPCPVPAQAARVRVEPELAFILGADLPARDTPYAPAEVDAAVASVHLALELIGSRYSDPADASFTENLADGLLNEGLFIGPEISRGQALACSDLPIRVRIAGAEDLLFDGRHPNGDARAPLHWLAEFLRSRGQGLQAGQAIITGSYAGSFTLPIGQSIDIEYGTVGMLRVHFTPE